MDAVAASVAEHVTHPTVLVLKSTVPVGTNERVQRIVAGAAHPVHVVSNPEFLKEGAAIKDFLYRSASSWATRGPTHASIS